MRKTFRIYCLFLSALLICAGSLGAQTPEFPVIADLKPETIFGSMFDPIFSALTIVFGYVSAYIPGISKIKPYYRVLAFALVAGLGFFLFGASFWKITVTYFITTRFFYDGFLVNILPSKKPATVSAG